MPEIGRISGPLLKSNLARDGVPLAFETDLLYLNVSDANPANHKIGIKNTNPGYTLDISGTIRTREVLLVKEAPGGPNAFADIDDINIDGNKIQTAVGNLVLQAATVTDRIQINSDTKISANLEVTGDITLGGSINIGDANTDNVVFGADVNSSIVPNITSTYDLGSSTKSWRTGYFDAISISGSIENTQIEISGNTIRTIQSNTDLEFDTAGTGRYVFIGTGGVIMPVGTTVERPTPPQIGMLRFNTDDARFENYNGEEWNRMIHDDDAIAFAIALG